MDINKLFQESLAELEQEGKFKELMKNTISTTVKSLFDTLFRDYGDFGKKLKYAMEAEINLDLSKVDLLHWQGLLNQIITEQMSLQLPGIVEPIKEKISEAMGVLEKKEWKLSEIIDKFKADIVNRDDSHGEIDLDIEVSNYGSTYVYFGNGKTDSSKKEWCLYLNSSDGNMYSYSHKDFRGVRSHKDAIKDPVTNFELFIFKLYASDSTVILNPREIDREYYTESY